MLNFKELNKIERDIAPHEKSINGGYPKKFFGSIGGCP